MRNILIKTSIKRCLIRQCIYKKNTLAVFTSFLFLTSFFFSINLYAQSENYLVPLTDSTNIDIAGLHRFITISGLKGYQPTSIHTKASFETSIHRKDQGSISFWFSPLEDMSTYSINNTMKEKDKFAFIFPLISDTDPARNVDAMNFGIYWNPGYPSLVARFTPGYLWGLMDYGRAPFAWAESLKLRKNNWYYVTVNWDKPQKQIWMYVNGELLGHHFDKVTDFAQAKSKLYIGNPSMVIRDIRLTDKMLSPETIANNYISARPSSNQLADSDIKKYTELANLPPLDIVRDDSWKEVFSCSFKEQNDLDGWVFQTGDEYRDLFDVKITDEGLLIKSPDLIDNETRMYLWSPQSFEGDQWIEFDFRPESPEGLSLAVFCASGSQRQDFINDFELEKTGNMNVILSKTRNYHWEFFRRVYMNHTEVETQYLLKNPWAKTLSYSCIPHLEQNSWYRLRFIKEGNRIYGSINGVTVFDVRDDAGVGHGPVLNYGRFGFRHMFKTTMRYRNFVVYKKIT